MVPSTFIPHLESIDSVLRTWKSHCTAQAVSSLLFLICNACSYHNIINQRSKVPVITYYKCITSILERLKIPQSSPKNFAKILASSYWGFRRRIVECAADNALAIL